MILLWFSLSSALARDFAIKAHDPTAALSGPLEVTLSGDGKDWRFTLRDDGEAPDGMAGDHLFTAQAAGVPLDAGTVRVQAGGRSWEGNFMFEEGSDPVLLIGLDPSGRPSTSTHEVMYTPEGAGGPGGQPGGPGTMPGTAPGGAGTMQGPGAPGTGPGAQAGITPGTPGAAPGAKPRREERAAPRGLWTGLVVLGASLAGIGAIARLSARRPPRRARLNRADRATAAQIGSFAPPPPGVEDLWVGGAPPGALALEEGPWTPEEIALALGGLGAVRVVVGSPAQVDGSYEELRALLEGRADLLWTPG